MVTSNRDFGKAHHERTMRDIRAAQAGDIEARNRVIEDNIGLVHKAIDRVIFPKPRLEHGDYVAIAVEAMIRCIALFDTHRGLRFSTYTTRVIVQKVRREMNTRATAIRIPSGQFNTASLNDPLKAGKRRIAQRVGSLDAVSRDSGRPRVLIGRNPPLCDEAILAEERTSLMLAIACLDDRERDIIDARMKGETLADIARRLGVSRERTRQVETEALRKLSSIMGGTTAPTTMFQVMA